VVEVKEILENHLTRTDINIVKGNEALKDFNTKLKNLNPYYFLKFSFSIHY
jgi:hypothetical protein